MKRRSSTQRPKAQGQKRSGQNLTLECFTFVPKRQLEIEPFHMGKFPELKGWVPDGGFIGNQSDRTQHGLVSVVVLRTDGPVIKHARNVEISLGPGLHHSLHAQATTPHPPNDLLTD